MENRYGQIRRFLDIGAELAEGKYGDADGRISALLEAIAQSRDLRELFTAVTKDFDYPAACAAYLKFPASPGAPHGVAYLPADRSRLLAFVFCLFAEFDAGKRKLDDFLLRYFYVDGSYTASYARFADRLVRPFMEIVQGCFRNVSPARAVGEGGFEELLSMIAGERTRLSPFDLPEEEREAAEILLEKLSEAAERHDGGLLRALLTGYRYFLRSFGGESERTDALFALAETL